MRSILVALAGLAASFSVAHATVVDFESVPGTNFDPQSSTQGFTFDFAAAGWWIGDPTVANYPDGVFNGTNILVASDNNRGSAASVTMTADGGGVFSLTSLDASSSNDAITNTVDILGNIQGGGTVMATLSLGTSFASYNLSGFSNLVSIVFTSGTQGPYNTAGFALDNLDTGLTNPVPVPAALPLMLAGLAGLGAANKRRKAA